MTNFFLSEMYRVRKHLVIQTAGVWLWSTSERQTLRYRASLSRATLDPSQRRRVKQNPTPRAAQWEPVVPVFTPNAQAKIKTKTKFRERTQILSGKQRRKIPSPSFWFSTSDLELLRSARAPLPGGRASGGKTTVNCRHFHRSVNKRDALNSWISSSRQWRSSWQNINMFESVQLWTFRCYLEASLTRVDAGFFFSMCVCECVVQVFTCIHKLPTRPPYPPPWRVHISSAAFFRQDLSADGMAEPLNHGLSLPASSLGGHCSQHRQQLQKEHLTQPSRVSLSKKKEKKRKKLKVQGCIRNLSQMFQNFFQL